MAKFKVDEEALYADIKLNKEVDGDTVKFSTDEDSYTTLVTKNVELSKVQVENLNKFNNAYAKVAVTKLADELKDTYNSNNKVKGFEAEIDFMNSPIVGKGDKIVTGTMNGETWETTGMTIKHDGYSIRGLKGIKKSLYEGLTK